ncbi:MAG: RIP metalloprotease RseP [Candidatus Eremiobacteraeota bacterium]|nr:RIP metalloprotease RseP [Candidatus Eremiobacteraeota bacterium]MBV9646652.1 RIP metalloprotease RseP [Candidatus Eremiobacteraeota bacterium]
MILFIVALPFFDSLGRIVVFLLMLSILVVLHELGHFILARLNGVRVNDFAVGFGPTLLKWTSPRTGTNYRLNVFPIGGYCAMHGEDGRSSEAQQQRAFRATGELGDDNFQSKSTWQRLSIIAAGPVANFIVALVVLIFVTMAFGAATDRVSTVIGPLDRNSPGARAGLQIGDRIAAINGMPMSSGEKMVKTIHGSTGAPLRLTILRHGQQLQFTVTPEVKVDRQTGKRYRIIGFQTQPTYETVSPGAAIVAGSQRFFDLVTLNVLGLGSLIIHPQTAAAQVSGPVGIGALASQAQQLGWGPYLQLAAAISVALGIFNFLPIPALDGGRGVFIIAEMLRGRPVDPEKEALVHVTGFALLMMLMVFVAYHDITNIVTSKAL